jgi:plasmid stabilization system protein ParE
MTFEVFYAPEASDDIDRAFEWFAARAPAVATDFLRAIGQAEIHLERNPAIYRVVREGGRATCAASTFDRTDTNFTFS